MTAPQLTYNSLVSLLKSASERSDSAQFESEIPNFIMLAENSVATELRTLGFQLVVSGTLGASQPTLPKPSYWRENISLVIELANGRRKTLFLRPLEYLQTVYPDRSATGEPVYYADYNFDNFLVAPTPNQDYDFELAYYARLDPLAPDHQTNWLTVHAPQLLVFAAMVEAQSWLKNWDQVGSWSERYTRALAGLTNEERRRTSDRTATMEAK